MDLRQLNTFKAIAEEGSFVRAAERLQYAQSTISLQIQQLEEELGVELFDRQRRKIQLTPAGRALLMHAQHVINQVAQLQQDLAAIVTGESGHLRIGMIEAVARLYLPEILRKFRARYPRIQLTIEVLSTIHVHEQLAADQIDLGVSTPPATDMGLVFEPLQTAPIMLLLSEQHPLCQQPTITLSDLKDECLLLTHPPCAYRSAIEQAFVARGLPLATNIEIGSIEVIKQAVQQGLGIALVPELATHSIPPGIVIRNVSDLHLHLPLGLITRAIPIPQGKAAQAFSSLLRQTMTAA
ncbi:DNA-binding transcriptional LysR family regulator [Thermosporothrix hazakensis]|jgi:DNA-binding transcriptional LysR family regulator|uniref:DNA-binding transcriptional LysR family regulator n=1 Tax=Thermosporothrix hazakensis TaxID=644383 RepID=A0A326U5Y9_THEHA|nr:LysR family transcriptional regulator [Thermosporothrix hazakensis]PZW27970.1 DNA-binding transcriptional LysR family regulator [Thermosporothrix hazakensis]GCE51193.1 LysR family transcriptional regulator [Thermosporothrix hazakensis]